MGEGKTTAEIQQLHSSYMYSPTAWCGDKDWYLESKRPTLGPLNYKSLHIHYMYVHEDLVIMLHYHDKTT